jgi:hypothetical protein
VPLYEIGDILREEVGYDGVQYHLITGVVEPDTYTPKYELYDIQSGRTSTFWCKYAEDTSVFTKVN